MSGCSASTGSKVVLGGGFGWWWVGGRWLVGGVGWWVVGVFIWGKEGRVGVYTANFGDIMGNDTGRLGLTALAGVSAAILCGQETSDEFLALAAQNDRICSDARFASSRSTTPAAAQRCVIPHRAGGS